MGRVWTTEDRLKQAERIRTQKPWTKSTGPRTAAGKRTASLNAYKHGYYTTEMKQIFLYLRLQKSYIGTLRFLNRQEKLVCLDDDTISQNELNKNSIKSIQNATDGCVKTARFSTKNPQNDNTSKEAIKSEEWSIEICTVSLSPTQWGRGIKGEGGSIQIKTRLVGRVFKNCIKESEIIQRQLFS